ncbi:hypothetical protein MUO32_22405 [Shinella sp. CPCC 101442]|uniref:hypothetical protein n=1 Tax=Shinella sp. CPCC 101442 TaxID=2932265 RepID=UPI00215382F6|nr:hypothetical protein [Shinella sp. CPCC 101442]MCR6501793.1 hypothetical protein [Shinella sp. CPCC 101442]
MRFASLLASILAVFSLGLTSARSEEFYAYMYENEEQPAAHLTFSPCTGEEVSECAAYSLSCDPARSPPLQISIITGPVEPMAIDLIKASAGLAYAKVALSAGGKSIDLPISMIHVDANEMDGGWMLSLGTYDTAPMLDTLSKDNSEGATIAIGDRTFALAPQKGDGAKLVQWRDACIRIRGN